MASSTPPTAAIDALGFMDSVTPFIRLYRPTELPPDSASERPPKLVLLFAWMDALDPHIAKYAKRYTELYPSASLVVIKRPFRHYWPGTHDGFQAVQPLLPIIRAAVDQDHADDINKAAAAVAAAAATPKLLIHVFSNGGCSTLTDLYKAWDAAERDKAIRQTPPQDPRLPLHAAVFDSVPGEWSHRINVDVLMRMAPANWLLRLLVLPLVHLFVAALELWVLLFDPPDPLTRLRAAQNDPTRVWEARRSYLYSVRDRLVDWQSVEEHAAEAQRRGFSVRLEKFERGEHVSLVRVDEERYWRVVRETWEGGE